MKTNDKNRAVIAESIARAWKDSDFKSKLLSDPKGTLADAGASIDSDHQVSVVENTPSLTHAVLPRKEDQAAHSDQIDAALDELRNMPDGMEVRVHRDTASQSTIALPVAPSATGELSDADLEEVAGGKGGSNAKTQGTVVQTGYSATTVAVDVEVEVGAAAAVAVVVVPCLVS